MWIILFKITQPLLSSLNIPVRFFKAFIQSIKPCPTAKDILSKLDDIYKSTEKINKIHVRSGKLIQI